MIKEKTHLEFKRTNAWLFMLLILSVIFTSCKKDKIKAVEVYPDAPGALVKFLEGNPNPASGSEGSIVVFNVKGLKDKLGKFDFFINQTKAEVIGVTDNTVTVKIPANASTGGASVIINGEVYFGPIFTVRGKVSIDPTFNSDSYVSNGAINEMISWDASTYLISGSFTDYQKQANIEVLVPGIAKLNKSDLGFQNPGATASQFNVGKTGINGPITTVIPVDNSKFLVAGSFTKYDTITNVSSITRINQDGSVDSMLVDVVGTPPLDQEVVPSFNGGVAGKIERAFYISNTKQVILVGNFSSYVSTFYERSSVGGPLLDFTNARQLIRLNSDGSFDSSFNFNKGTNSSNAGGNGYIYDAISLPDGNIIIVGNFTTFNGIPANHIVRINGNDGSVDQSFTGSADGDINRIVRNQTTGNILVSGNFKNYNGQPANGVVMINKDGVTNPAFIFSPVDGLVNFAGQLNNGKIIVSGTFNKYGDVVRAGMAILNSDGSLASGYNNMGLFRGQINNFIETVTSTGIPAVILYGAFDRFDNKPVGNIVRFQMQN